MTITRRDRQPRAAPAERPRARRGRCGYGRVGMAPSRAVGAPRGARLRGRARLGLLRVGDGLQVDHAHLAHLPDAVRARDGLPGTPRSDPAQPSRVCPMRCELAMACPASPAQTPLSRRLQDRRRVCNHPCVTLRAVQRVSPARSKLSRSERRRRAQPVPWGCSGAAVGAAPQSARPLLTGLRTA